MPPKTDFARLAIVEHLLKQILPVAVLPVDAGVGDLILRDAHRELTITVRSLGATSRVMIESAIVHAAALVAHAHNSATGGQHRHGICLLLERISETSPAEICELLAGAKLPLIDMMLVARHGRSWVHLPTFGLPGRWIDRPDDIEHDATLEPLVRNVFTRANLWLFKTILYSGMRKGQAWSHQWRSEGWKSATDLAKAGALSVPTVTRGLQSMMQRGWIGWKRGDRIRCLLPDLAMSSWVEHARVVSMHRDRICVTPVYDTPTGARQMIEWLAARRGDSPSGDRWAITGWHAAEHYGMRIVSSLDQKLVTVVTDGSLREYCDRWKLVSTHPRDARFVIEQEKDVHLQESAFCDRREDQSGPTSAAPGVRWVDPLQSAIDVARDPMQGPAQAEAIIDALSRACAE